MNPSPTGYVARGVSLRQLIQEAYDAHDKKLLTGGPAWLDSEKFDVVAKLDDSDIPAWQKLSYRQRADILQSLLAQRFGLKVHYETQVFPVFNLLVTKGGPKLSLTPPEGRDDLKSIATCYIVQSRRGYSKRRDCLIFTLAEELRYATGRSVIDKTGLTARYDFELRWTPDDSTPTASDNAEGPSIFAAVQEQLGLKLEPSTAPLKVLVIDHAEHPNAN